MGKKLYLRVVYVALYTLFPLFARRSDCGSSSPNLRGGKMRICAESLWTVPAGNHRLSPIALAAVMFLLPLALAKRIALFLGRRRHGAARMERVSEFVYEGFDE